MYFQEDEHLRECDKQAKECCEPEKFGLVKWNFIPLGEPNKLHLYQ